MSAARTVVCALAALSLVSCEGGGVGSAAPPRAGASASNPAPIPAPSASVKEATSEAGAPSSSAPVEAAPSPSAASPAPTASGLPEPHKTYYDEEGERCTLVRVTPSGSVVLLLRGAEQELPLAGIDLPNPLPPAFAEVVERTPRRNRRLACVDWPARGGRPAAVIVKYYVRQDKAGDVWDDLGATLLEVGLARVAAGELPDKNEYLKREARARAERRGIWAKAP